MAEPAAVVTGANTGVGRATAEALASLGRPTILACRSLERAEPVVDEIRQSTGNGGVVAVRLDLSDLHDVARAADEILARSQVDVLVNNAGAMVSARSETRQGLEWTFGVNYLGHYLLTRLLLPSLVDCAPSHVVNVSSIAHRFVRDLRWDDLQLERRYSVYQSYSQSKLAQILFTGELARRLVGTGVVANAAHPGAVRSRLAQDGDSTRVGERGADDPHSHRHLTGRRRADSGHAHVGAAGRDGRVLVEATPARAVTCRAQHRERRAPLGDQRRADPRRRHQPALDADEHVSRPDEHCTHAPR